MSNKYKKREIDKAYFLTLTVTGWIDVFSHKFWQDGNQAKEIYGFNFLEEKLDYIHNNPVEEMSVSKAEDYLFSSARNYAEMESLLDVCLISRKWKTQA